MIFNTLKDKCKYFQELYNYKLMPNSYVLVHLDGVSFSKKVKKKFELPFDKTFINMMNETAKYLCENVPAVKIAYTQSDEISLLMKSDNYEMFRGGRLNKIQSIMASMASTKFNQLYLLNYLGKNSYMKDSLDFIRKAPLFEFDCKVWCVPSIKEANEWFLFRHRDCVRNSKQQCAQTYCLHKELVGKNTDEQIQYMKDTKGVDWNDFDDSMKYGRILHKVPHTFQTILNNEPVSYERKKWEISNGNVPQESLIID